MTFANLLRALALWGFFAVAALVYCALWSSAGYAVIDAWAMAYAARWAA